MPRLRSSLVALVSLSWLGGTASADPAHAPKPAKTPPVLAKSAPAKRPKPRENPYLEVPDRAFAESTPAYRYANLSDDEAITELERHPIA